MRGRYFILLFIAILFASCAQKPNLHKVRVTGETQGTYFAITYYDSLQRDLRPQIDSLLGLFNNSINLWNKNSILSRINAADTNQQIQIDPIFKELFVLSQEISARSNGAFDFTVGPLTSAWGFGASDTIAMDSVVVDSLLQFVGYNKVRLQDNYIIKDLPNIHFDFNAIAQGYTCDYIGEWFESENIYSYIIDVGGEVVAHGLKPDLSSWIVGIQDPSLPNEFKSCRTVKLLDKGLVTSGNYRKHHKQSGRKVVHTINPRTGYPVEDSLVSATVLAKNATYADGFATACMVMGMSDAIAFIESDPNLEALFLYNDTLGSIKSYYTDGIEEILLK
ncbi:MAG: FAD:protein FMN transferase [Bacteroidales bacterium]